ncbi:uncharacterized protein LOC121052887 [Rosa chinensis]|uniref:uncharacterized protein LOC121052887 n=1 Tax=Rosa chinensis TaxID=74649 RepID=UPI001AD90CD9|nr:uncharacterized protein LOC121052887 [Rosa chinensis]
MMDRCTNIDEQENQKQIDLSAVNTHMSDLPDLVIDKILGLIPTKAAFQVSFLCKQRQDVVSSFPVLNFNEDDDFDRHNLNRYRHYKHQHKRFINFLKGYLDYRKKKDQQKELLNKLSLHMRMFSRRDSSTITEWLKYACERGLKELDISPKMSVDPTSWIVGERPPESLYLFYILPWVAIASAKSSLTCLKLECVRVPHLLHVRVPHAYERLFPSLKTLSLKTSRVVDLDSLLFECPSMESLSLTQCSIGNSEFYVQCSSLKSLEIKYCRLHVIQVDQAFNLESFTFLSPPTYSRCEKMILKNAFNLKHINICVDYVREFFLLGSHRALEATIDRYVHLFEFFDGYLNANVSVKAYEATILVGELLDQEWFSSYSTHFPKLMTFLRKFRSCSKINLYVQALIIPKNYRKMTSVPPLPETFTLQAWMSNPPLVGSIVYLEMEDSLQWIAPLAQILIMPVDVEEDRKKYTSKLVL